MTSANHDPRPQNSGTPTDTELMSWFDGELADEERRAEIARWVEQDESAQDKLAALRAIGQLLRDDAQADQRADGIADRVMDRIAEREEPSGGELVELPQRAARDLPRTGLPRRRASNDNARTIYALAAVAAVVALGLFFWGRSGLENTPLAEQGADTGAQMAATAPAPATAALAQVSPTGAASSAASDDSALAPADLAAVEVAEVDFGAHSGSVFYVSAGAGEADETTAVVWVTDDVAGEGP